MGDVRAHGPRRIRREDPALITGNAQYTDDISEAELLHAAVCRSQFGHAGIVDVDASAAEDRDGVVAVFTAADLAASDAPGTARVAGSLPKQTVTEFPMLASDAARFTGEAIAVVVAEDRYVAHEAVDLIDVEYERRDAVTNVDEALRDDAPVVDESSDDNLAFDWEFGDDDAVDRAFDAADRVVSLDIGNQRLIPDAMEPRAALADYDPDDGHLTVRMSTQVPHRARSRISEMTGLPEDRIRVIAPDVGGGFGSKGGAPYAEEPLAAWCSMQVERPVKWISTRSESHQTDHHGRDVDTSGELAIDADGTVRGLRVEAVFNLGAYVVWGATPASNFKRLISGPYEIPAIYGHAIGALTNTTPVAPYRGAGRPEAIYVVERLLDRAAAELDLDPAEVRRRNFVAPDAFPYETALGTVYDSGDYEAAMERALDIVDYDAVRDRQERLREEGRYLGVGIGSFVENTGTAPSRPETVRVEIDDSGTATAYCGTTDHGQGHGTVFAQLVADELGVDYDDVVIREGDTDDLEHGMGTFGSRSAPVGASALVESARDVREKARRLAAHRFEASVDDVEFENGEFFVAGVPERSIHVRELAAYARSPDLPDDVDPDLEATVSYDPPNYAYSFGTHVAVVEVDPRSGELAFERYVAVDDCGVQLNPLIVEGQVHGGVAQGIGQALYEHAVYDDNGTLLTGSLQDYALPKAMHIPELEADSTVTPCPHNPTGAKGVGEGGALGAPPTVVNAVVDALEPLGVDRLDMPLTAETVWRAIEEADGGA